MATVNGTVAAGGDDVQFYNTGAWAYDPTNTTCWFGRWNSLYDIADVRFTLDAAVPAGATITSAIASYYGNNDNTVSDFWAYVVEDDDAAQVTGASDRPTWAAAGNTVTYPTTEEGSGAVHWTGYGWTYDAYNNLTITGLIQHLVDTYGGLVSGAHIRVVLVGDSGITSGTENGFMTNNYGSLMPTLTITYTSGVTGSGPHQSTIIQGNW